MLGRKQVFTYQRALVDMGFDPGPIDGIVGPKTIAAARKAALSIGLETDTPPPLDPNDAFLVRELEREEGRKLYAYQDHLGFWTIGIGRLIDKRKGGGITDVEADYLKRNDIARVKQLLDVKVPWWRELDPVRQRAVQNMAFQLGTGDMHGAAFDLIRAGQYAQAADRLREWKWAKQTPERAARVIRMIEHGRV